MVKFKMLSLTAQTHNFNSKRSRLCWILE